MKKTTSQKFSKRLVQYSALSAALAGIADASGQIVYHDLNPDVGVSNDVYSLDFDEDNFADFTIRHRDGASKGILDILPACCSNAILGNNYNYYSGGAYRYPFALNAGDPISASANPFSLPRNSWNSYYVYQNMDFWGSCGNPGYRSLWCGKTDKYLGLRFVISNIMGDFTHYGWAKLTVDNTPHGYCTIQEYAYNSAPGQPITAGQMPLGIDDQFMVSKIKVVTSGKTIGLHHLPEMTSYKLYNLTGQEVMRNKINGNDYVIDAQALSTGIYVLELNDVNSNQGIRKKVVLYD